MADLGFRTIVSSNSSTRYFQRALIKTAKNAWDIDLYLNQLNKFLFPFLNMQLNDQHEFQLYPTFRVMYAKQVEQTRVGSIKKIPLHSTYISKTGDIQPFLDWLLNNFRKQNDYLRQHEFSNKLEQIMDLELAFSHKKSATMGCTYEELPPYLARKFCIVNVKNTDQRCFGYSILASATNIPSKHHPNNPSNYNLRFTWRGLDKLQYPVSLADIPEIEKKLQIGLNIYSFSDEEGRIIYPEYNSSGEYDMSANLLYWNGHFAWINNFNRFMEHNGLAHWIHEFCPFCMANFETKEEKVEHIKSDHPKQTASSNLLSASNDVAMNEPRYGPEIPSDNVLYEAGVQTRKLKRCLKQKDSLI